MSTSSYDQDLARAEKTVTNGIRSMLGLSGLLALIIGILILVWPGKTAVVVAGIIVVYAAIAGIVNLAVGIFSRKIGGWSRFGYLLLGVVFLVAAVVAFSNLKATAAALAALLGILVGIAWIVEGIVGLSTLGNARSKTWAIIYAILSVIAGVLVMMSPIWGAAILWLLIGLSLVILGITQLIRAFRFGPA